MITPRQSSVAIVGGRIGGLAAALSLLRAGFDVQVYEQAAALGEVGARINIGPNASRILHRLGLEAVLERIGVKPVAFRKNAMLRWPVAQLTGHSPPSRGSMNTMLKW